MRAREFISETAGPTSSFKPTPMTPATKIASTAPTKVKWVNKQGTPSLQPTGTASTQQAVTPGLTQGVAAAAGLSNFGSETNTPPSKSPNALGALKAGFTQGFKQSMGLDPNKSIAAAATGAALKKIGMSGTAQSALTPGSEIDMPKLGKVKVAKQTGDELELDTKQLLGANLKVNLNNQSK